MWDPNCQLQDIRQMAKENRKLADSFIFMTQDICTELGRQALDQWNRQATVQADISRDWLRATRKGMDEFKKITDISLKMMEDWTWPTTAAASPEAGAEPAPKKAAPVTTVPAKAAAKPAPKTAAPLKAAPPKAPPAKAKPAAKSTDKTTAPKKPAAKTTAAKAKPAPKKAAPKTAAKTRAKTAAAKTPVADKK